MRLRIAEIDQHAVTHVPRDEAIELGDNSGDGAVISADHIAQIFGVDARRELGRADQVAEHDSQLSPLGLCSDSRAWGRRRRCLRGVLTIAERSNGVEQAAAMADRRNAKLAQVVGRQPA